jgi:general secretion pathway protein G
MMERVQGFTLIELLVSLTLLALILSSAAPVMELSARRAKEAELKRGLWEMRDAIDAYKKAVDEGLVKRSPGQSGYPPNLQILVQGVENQKDLKKRRIYFLRRIPRDPFVPNQELSAEEGWGKRSYASSFEEPREGDDVYDVYSLSSQIGINQQPYREW